MNKGTTTVSIKKVNHNGVNAIDDILAIEEPLEIRIAYQQDGQYINKNLSITMRTPGNDEELAVGFLFTEGIITSANDVKSVLAIPDNTVLVTLNDDVSLDLSKLERHFYTTSSCGVCGKSSIDSVRTVCRLDVQEEQLQVPLELIHRLPDLLRKQQSVFEDTGGIHASALFDLDANILLTKEDVGRHNALDKLIGAALEKGLLPLNKYILLLSGRASFELIQKASMAGIKVVAAVGAPSSLAVELAKEFDMTLIGFLRNERFNIYSGDKRITL